MRKILVVLESINVNDSSATKGRVALIQNLKNSGYDIKVYHYTRKDIDLKGIDCVSIPEQKFTLMYVFSKLQVLLWRVFKININPFFEKRLGFSFSYFNDVYSIKKALHKETDFNPDWVLTLSKAASFRVHKAVLKLPKWHSKWLAYVHDPYPMHFYPRPYNWVAPGYYQQQEFFRDVSKTSAHGIFPSQLLKEWMGSYYPDFIERGIVIPHQISASDISTSDLPSYFEENKFTILHAGSLMKQRNPKGLIDGFELFLNNNPETKADTQLLLLGNKAYFEAYLNDKRQQISQLYVSSGYVSYDEVQCMQQHASVNVVLEAKSEISPFLPGKFPHCVSANKPILYLGPKQSECLRLLGETYPYVAEIDEANNIAKHIEQMYCHWKNKSESQYLNRLDLEHYMSAEYLKATIDKLSA